MCRRWRHDPATAIGLRALGHNAFQGNAVKTRSHQRFSEHAKGEFE
jgi:hypothetical protein